MWGTRVHVSAKGYEVSFGSDENVLQLIVGWLNNLVSIFKNYFILHSK